MVKAVKIEVTYEINGVCVTEPIACDGAMIVSKSYNTLIKPQIRIAKQTGDPLLGYFYFNFPEMQTTMVQNALHGDPDIAPQILIPKEKGIIIDLKDFIGRVDKPKI